MSDPTRVEPAKKSTRLMVPSPSLAAALIVRSLPAVNVLPSAGAVSATCGGWFVVDPAGVTVKLSTTACVAVLVRWLVVAMPT